MGKFEIRPARAMLKYLLTALRVAGLKCYLCLRLHTRHANLPAFYG